jgi:hypothetical protein
MSTAVLRGTSASSMSRVKRCSESFWLSGPELGIPEDTRTVLTSWRQAASAVSSARLFIIAGDADLLPMEISGSKMDRSWNNVGTDRQIMRVAGATKTIWENGDVCAADGTKHGRHPARLTSP